MQEKKIIVSSAFNTHAFRETRFTKEWIDTRMDIFMNYTLRSLKAQTNQKFIAYILYDKTTEELIQNAISRYEELPGNIQFISYNLYNLKLKSEIKDSKYFYLVRIDCDDMYHISYIQQLWDFKPKPDTQVIINQKGYLYDSVEKRLANYFFESPPFYTMIYKSQEYIKGLRYKLPGGHAGAIQLPHQIIDMKNFVFHIHSANTLNRFNQRFNKGELITDVNKINEILRNYIGKVE